MSIRKKLLQLVFPLVLALGISASPAAAVGNVALADKGDYEDSRLYVDLDLLPDDVTDDGNFVVMKEGAVILYKDSSSTMRLEVSQDKTTYTLHNPTEAAKGILPGTPVAFVDKAAGQAAFFLPTHVAAGADQIVFTCSPEYVKAEQLFSVAAITGNKTFTFGQGLNYSDDVLDFQGHLAGTYNVNFSYNMNTYEMEATVSYDLTGAELKVKQNFEQEISLDNLVFTGFSGVDAEIGVGLEVSAQEGTEVRFELTDVEAGFDGSMDVNTEPNLKHTRQPPSLEVTDLAADAGFEVNLTLSPSVDLFSMAGGAFDLTSGISVAADLKGDEEFGEDSASAPHSWHLCKEFSCLEGEICGQATLAVRMQINNSATSAQYDLYHKKESDFHYSHTFDEFETAPCAHYLYLTRIQAVDSTGDPVPGVDIRYTEVPPYADRKGVSRLYGKTGEDGSISLYLPAGQPQVTALWAPDPDPSQETTLFQYSEDFTVDVSDGHRTMVIRLPDSSNLIQVSFHNNAGSDDVENMPASFVSLPGTVVLPNNAPCREGKIFLGWSTGVSGSVDYYPGGIITVSSPTDLYAIWSTEPFTNSFRTITYDFTGGELADNPQIYFQNSNFTLVNPWRQGYIFTGWTCDEIGLTEPELNVNVTVNNPSSGGDFIPRTYVANWTPVAYNVVWCNWDGTRLKIDRDAALSSTPTYTGATPVRPSDEDYYYVFDSWAPEITPVAADVCYRAQYKDYPLLKITSSPADQEAQPGETVIFALESSGGVGDVTYQWYVIPTGEAGQPSAGAGTAISGATGSTLTLTAEESLNGNWYYCLVTDTVGQQVASQAVALTCVKSPEPSSKPGSDSASDRLPQVSPAVPQQVTGQVGQWVTCTVTAQDGQAYQWYLDRQDGQGPQPLAGATEASFSARPLGTDWTGYAYYCKVTNALGSTMSPAFVLVVEGASSSPAVGAAAGGSSSGGGVPTATPKATTAPEALSIREPEAAETPSPAPTATPSSAPAEDGGTVSLVWVAVPVVLLVLFLIFLFLRRRQGEE